MSAPQKATAANEAGQNVIKESALEAQASELYQSLTSQGYVSRHIVQLATGLIACVTREMEGADDASSPAESS